MVKRRQCLIIDDDIDDQEILAYCINQINNNIDCIVALNGVDALHMLNMNPMYTPEYIFLEVYMPEMNGIECLRRLKNIDRLNKAKVFMYSTTSDKPTVMLANELGAEEFIVKPAKLAQLQEKLCQIFYN